MPEGFSIRASSAAAHNKGSAIGFLDILGFGGNVVELGLIRILLCLDVIELSIPTFSEGVRTIGGLRINLRIGS